MRTIEASAPGKAVLSGEYAVLEGAPAIAMAIDRRARVLVEVTGNASHTVRSPGWHERTLHFRTPHDGSIDWLDDVPANGEGALLEQVWRCAQPSFAEHVALTLDTRSFFDETGEAKLGFGSSAALAVALTAALHGNAAISGKLHREAARAHRDFQEGKGSGVDVAAAFYGGVIAFIMEGMRIERLGWPGGLRFGLLWSGKPASTADKLARLEHSLQGGAPVSGVGLADAAAAVHENWRRGETAAILQSFGVYADALLRFSADHDLGVFDAGHRDLFDEAAKRGLVYKPCGAGGGDVGVVLAAEQSAIGDFTQRAEQYGFRAIDARLDPCGVRLAAGDAR